MKLESDIQIDLFLMAFDEYRFKLAPEPFEVFEIVRIPSVQSD